MRVSFGRLTWPPVAAKFLLSRRLLLCGDWPELRRKSAGDRRYYISPTEKPHVYLTALIEHKYRYWSYNHNRVLIT